MSTDEGGNTVGPTADLRIFKMYVQLTCEKFLSENVKKVLDISSGMSIIIDVRKRYEGGNPK
jgi:hypothetical protein